MLTTKRIYVLTMYLLGLVGGASILSPDSAASSHPPITPEVNEIRIAGHSVVKSFAVEPNAFTPNGEWPSGKFVGIQSIVEDRTETIRVSTAKDFLRYEEGTNIWSSFGPGAPHEGTRCSPDEPELRRGQIVVDQSGRIWVKGQSGQPAYFDSQWHQTDSRPTFMLGDYITHIDPSWKSDPSMAEIRMLDNKRHTLFLDNRGHILYVTPEAVARFDNGAWRPVISPTADVAAAYSRLNPLFVEPQSTDGGQPKTDQARSEHDQKRRSMLSEVFCGIQDRAGNTWLGAERALITFSASHQAWRLHPTPADFFGVAGILEGRYGRLWTFDLVGKIALYDPTADAWTVWNPMDYLPNWDNDPVRTQERQAAEKKSVQIIEEYVRKMRSLTPGIQPLPTPQSGHWLLPPFSPLRVNTLYEDHSGRLMLGTDNGLVIFEPSRNKWQIVNEIRQGLPNKHVLSICEDHLGRIWIGTEGGIVVLAP